MIPIVPILLANLWACGPGPADVNQMSLFRPGLAAGAPANLWYEPDQGWGEDDLASMREEGLQEWLKWFGPGMDRAFWDTLLTNGEPDEDEIASMRRSGPLPEGYEALPPKVDRRSFAEALDWLRFAREIEPFTKSESADGWDSPSRPTPPPRRVADSLLAWGESRLAKTKDPFLRQRWAFQLVRLSFYSVRDSLDDSLRTSALSERHRADLAGPSKGLWWRSRGYLAGARLKEGFVDEAWLGYARLVWNYPQMAPSSVRSFHPQSDSEWIEALANAPTRNDKALLWRLVGLRYDPMTAMEKIDVLEPGSASMELLAVRLVNQLESGVVPWDEEMSGQSSFSEQREAVRLRKLTSVVVRTGKSPHPWFWQLLQAHLSTGPSDSAEALGSLRKAVLARPGDSLFQLQARQTRSIVLARCLGPGHPEIEEVIFRGIADASDAYGGNIQSTVRAILSLRLRKWPGRRDDAALLSLPEPRSYSTPWAYSLGGSRTDLGLWGDPAFLERSIRRARNPSSGLERWLARDSLRSGSDKFAFERILQTLRIGRIAEAAKLARRSMIQVAVDPFVSGLLDTGRAWTRDPGDSNWNLEGILVKMDSLTKVAQGKDENAAEAAIRLGTAFYAFTWHGPARTVFSESRAPVLADTLGEHWFRRAIAISRNKETRAWAVFLMAKSEQARRYDLKASKTPSWSGKLSDWWATDAFALLNREYSDTKVYQRALQECGTFRSWLQDSR